MVIVLLKADVSSFSFHLPQDKEKEWYSYSGLRLALVNTSETKPITVTSARG